MVWSSNGFTQSILPGMHVATELRTLRNAPEHLNAIESWQCPERSKTFKSLGTAIDSTPFNSKTHVAQCFESAFQGPNPTNALAPQQ
jgi:hypothetical protein